MTKRKRNLRGLLMIAVLGAFAGAASGQVTPKPFPVPPPGKKVSVFPAGAVKTSERFIAVDPKVNLSIPCVNRGELKINGWNRNEIRVFVSDGSGIGFKILQKGRQSEAPVWVNLIGTESAGECLWGDEIEIDVPVGATLNIKGRETRIRIDSVRKAGVKNVGGDISIRNVSEGVSAFTYEGGLSVENSEGEIVLESTTGNILVFGAGPSEIGDIFRAKTASGAVSLKDISHRQIEVNSVSGSVTYDGLLANGGVYSFGTSNGALTLGIPETSSLLVNAAYGFGNFRSDIPYKMLTENVSTAGKSLTAQIGTGDSRVNLTTASGAIRITKEQ